MHLRKLEPETQSTYVRAVRRLAEHLGRSPDTATAEDLRLLQLHLVDHGTSPITLNATLTANSAGAWMASFIALSTGSMILPI